MAVNRLLNYHLKSVAPSCDAMIYAGLDLNCAFGLSISVTCRHLKLWQCLVLPPHSLRVLLDLSSVLLGGASSSPSSLTVADFGTSAELTDTTLGPTSGPVLVYAIACQVRRCAMVFLAVRSRLGHCLKSFAPHCDAMIYAGSSGQWVSNSYVEQCVLTTL